MPLPIVGLTADTTWITTDRSDPKRCCVKRSKAKEPLWRERARGGGERQNRQALASAYNIRDLSLFPNPRVPGQEEKEGDRRLTVPGKRPPPLLLASSEPLCPTTSSSWKLPLGSAPRMPNSISQGACAQLGSGFSFLHPGARAREEPGRRGPRQGHPAAPTTRARSTGLVALALPPPSPCAPAAPRYRSAGASRWRPEAACGRAAAEQPVASAAVLELAMQS